MNQQDQGYNRPSVETDPARQADSDNAPSFNTLLRRYRRRAGLTQEMLAEKAGLGVNTIGNLERAVSQPYRDTVQALAEALELSPDEQAAFTAAADRGRATLLRDTAPDAGLERSAMDEQATTGAPPSSVRGRRRSGPLSLLVERSRRSGTRLGGLLVAVILAAVLGVTMVAGPRFSTAPRGHTTQPKASGSSCGSEGGWPILCMGARGTPVYALQYMLNGYDPTYNLTVDGVFGSRTEHAAQDFQRRNAVQGDAPGIIGVRTWTALAEQMEVHLHSAGSGVLALQYVLNHDPVALPAALSLDGSYGPKTQRALAGAEQSLGLHTTGSVTPPVWRRLLCAATRGCRPATQRR